MCGIFTKHVYSSLHRVSGKSTYTTVTLAYETYAQLLSYNSKTKKTVQISGIKGCSEVKPPGQIFLFSFLSCNILLLQPFHFLDLNIKYWLYLLYIADYFSPKNST